MAFIRLQNIKRDDKGNIVSGSASIIDVEYVTPTENRSKGHSKQTVRENIGRPLYISDDKRSGIFLSPIRGIVSYDVTNDTFENVDEDDPRIRDTGLFVPPPVHTEFGTGYLFMHFLEFTGLGSVLRTVFPKDTDYQRCLTHIYHTVTKNDERVRCDIFLERSFVQYLTPKVPIGCLKSDTAYFSMMGADTVKMTFFKAYVGYMKKTFPGFGRACYVDSTPLPNDMDDNPFDAFTTHGTGSAENQMRMAMVLDSTLGLPVWYDFYPGNVLDLSTLKDLAMDIERNLGIRITEYVLDAGFACKELIRAFPAHSEDGSDTDEDIRDIVVRMPARRGYPYKTLYHQCKDLLSNGKYDFLRKRHAYFGVRKCVRIFETEVYAYVYVDYDNALRGYRRYMGKHPKEFKELTDKDKTWFRYKEGFFILLSSIAEEPSAMLDRYFGRTQIECVFKTGMEYLDLLPLSKWTVDRVKGKVLNDVISLILYLELRKAVVGSPYAVPEVLSRCRSLQCILGPEGTIDVEAPNSHVKKIYAQFGMQVPARISLKDFFTGSS